MQIIVKYARPAAADPPGSCGPASVVDEGMSTVNAQEYLRQQVADLHASPSRFGHDLTMKRAEIRGVAKGLVAAGALTQDQSTEIISDLDPTDPPRIESITRTVSRRGDPTMRVDASAIEENTAETFSGTPEQSVESRGDETPAALERVVPIGKRLPPSGAINAIAISVEVWSTCTVLHLAYMEPGYDAAQQMREHSPWRGLDDNGLSYREVASYWSEATGALAETRVFTPGPTPMATTLTISASEAAGKDHSFTVPLRARPDQTTSSL